jgi:hypothetical protein
LLRENFDDLSEWNFWGSPKPEIVDVHNFENVFDNMGDSWCNSGIISKKAYDIRGKNLIIEADVYLEVDDYSGCWVEASIGITNGTEYTSGDCAYDGYPSYSISMHMDGDACWATPADKRKHTYLSGSLGLGANYSIQIDDKVNKWVKLKMVIDNSGYIKAYIDGQFMGASTEPIPEEVLKNAYIIIQGRSSGYGGKAYIDNVVVYIENETENLSSNTSNNEILENNTKVAIILNNVSDDKDKKFEAIKSWSNKMGFLRVNKFIEVVDERNYEKSKNYDLVILDDIGYYEATLKSFTIETVKFFHKNDNLFL